MSGLGIGYWRQNWQTRLAGGCWNTRGIVSHSCPFMYFFWRLTYQFTKSSCKCLQSIVNLPGNAFAKLLGCATSHARRVVAIRDISFLDPPRYHRVGLRRDRVRTDGLRLVGVIDLQDGREKPVCRTQYFTLRTQDLLKMGSARRMPFGARFPPSNFQDIHHEGVSVQPHICTDRDRCAVIRDN